MTTDRTEQIKAKAMEKIKNVLWGAMISLEKQAQKDPRILFEFEQEVVERVQREFREFRENRP